MRFNAIGDLAGCQRVKELHGKAPVGSAESTGPATDDVNFGDFEKLAWQIRQFRRAADGREDAVAIRRDPLSLAARSEAHEVSGDRTDQRQSTQMAGGSGRGGAERDGGGRGRKNGVRLLALERSFQGTCCSDSALP